jgi:hypothetical protein
MPEPAAHRPSPGSRYRRDPALLAALVIAVGLGLGAAAGSVFEESGTTASVRDAVVPAIIGALAGAVVWGVVLAVIRTRLRRHWLSVRPFAITAGVCALGLGALVGASMAPDEPVLGELLGTGGAETYVSTGSVAPAGVVVHIDRDADADPDVFDGEVILGFDVDNDDVVDGFLRRCSREPDPIVEEREGYVAIDLRCDSIVDDYLPYNDDRILTEFVPAVESPIDDDEGTPADALITIGLVIMLLGLLVALGFFLSQVALRERPLDRKFVQLSANLLDEPDQPIDANEIADLLQSSLDEVLIGADPRIAIRIAYGTLLHGLAEIGLPRRPEEGPDEHIERCLRAVDLPPRPIRELLRLFALARFSTHPITEDHRRRAIAAFDEAITNIRILEVVG